LYGIHNEDAARVNVVIYRGATQFLIIQMDAKGIREVRNILDDAVPGGNLFEWCITYPGGAHQCVRVSDLQGWFNSDVWNRSDLDDALRDAKSNQDCLAWTVVPSRNWTHKKHSCKGL
jgi:hypothetical protein